MRLLVIAVVSLLLATVHQVASIGCISESNDPVDWWYAMVNCKAIAKVASIYWFFFFLLFDEY